MAVWAELLALDDLRLLAQLANKAYQRCRQDFVSRDLLIGNVSAFRDVIRLVNRGKGKGIEPEERYFQGNLLTSEMIDAKTLIEYVDKWIALLEDRPSSMQAEFASRNLWTYLRDEEFSDESQIAKLLAQYVPELLQVAIRGYWNSERESLIERPKGSPPSDEPPRMMSPTCVGAVTMRTFGFTSTASPRLSSSPRKTARCNPQLRGAGGLGDGHPTCPHR